MKKLLLVLAAFLLTFALSACGGEELAELPDEVTMDNIDEFLARPDVQYVDVRDFDEKMSTGFITGFENIPYFDYLKYEGILVDANADWTFDAGEVLQENALKNLFDDTKAIFIMCGSGTRANYIKGALESLGYENVYNVGGYKDYDTTSEFNVLGDDTYVNVPDVKGPYTPGVYVGADDEHGYFVTVFINDQGGIQEVTFDAVYCSDTDEDGIAEDCNTKQVLGEDYGMRTTEGLTWAEMSLLLSDAIVANQGWDENWQTYEGTRHFYFDLDVADDPDTADVDETYEGDEYTTDALAGVTAGMEGFQVAWEDAIAQAAE